MQLLLLAINFGVGNGTIKQYYSIKGTVKT